MTNPSVNEAAVEDKLVEAMKNVEFAETAPASTMAALRDRLQASEAFIPKAKRAIEAFVEDKLASVRTETEELTRLIESKNAELTSKVEAMRTLQSEIVKLMAEVGHLRTHQVILNMSNFSHGQALGEIVAQGKTAHER